MTGARLAVIGGGYTGAAFAIHAIRAAPGPLHLTIVEPSAQLGRGIAYGAADPEHRINVPSARMSLVADEPDHATRWFFANGILPDPGSTDAQGHHYVPRHAYGSYVAAVLSDTIAAAGSRLCFEHRRATALSVARAPTGWRVDLSDGEVLTADQVVLCFGHAPPCPPCPISAAARQDPRYVANPWAPGAYRSIGPDDEVLIVGTGLTMADALASLRAQGHRGGITAISRNGLMPRPHGAFLDGIDILEGRPPPTTALGLSRLLRGRIARDHGRFGWPVLADALRSRLPELWSALPAHQKRKAVRRLLPFWEVHRFRIGPQVHAIAEEARASGRLRVERAAILDIGCEDGRLVATLRRRGQPVERRRYDAVVMCTGPNKDLRRNPLMATLIDAELARPDAVGLGLAVDRDSHLIDRDGTAQPDLIALGPVTRGTFGEMTGAPDIVRHIRSLTAGTAAAEQRPP